MLAPGLVVIASELKRPLSDVSLASGYRKDAPGNTMHTLANETSRFSGGGMLAPSGVSMLEEMGQAAGAAGLCRARIRGLRHGRSMDVV